MGVLSFHQADQELQRRRHDLRQAQQLGSSAGHRRRARDLGNLSAHLRRSLVGPRLRKSHGGMQCWFSSSANLGVHADED